MKSAIIYYSYSGNTACVANTLAEYFKDKGSVELIELLPQDESGSFFGQCKRAFWKKRAQLQGADFNLSNYDLICFGTPVWAFGSTPAMNTCLDKCSSVENKEIILFTTYGSGTGNQRCLDYMQKLLSEKGAKRFMRFSIQQFKVKDKAFVLSKIQELMRLPPQI